MDHKLHISKKIPSLLIFIFFQVIIIFIYAINKSPYLYALGQEKPVGLPNGILMIEDINIIHKKRNHFCLKNIKT